MSRKETQTRLVRVIDVVDSSGQQRRIEERGVFMRVQYFDNSWSEWSRSTGRLVMGTEHINETDDENVFEVASTGERLTALPRAES